MKRLSILLLGIASTSGAVAQQMDWKLSGWNIGYRSPPSLYDASKKLYLYSGGD